MVPTVTRKLWKPIVLSLSAPMSCPGSPASYLYKIDGCAATAGFEQQVASHHICHRPLFAENRVIAEEAVYFKRSDETCMKRLLAKHPEARTEEFGDLVHANKGRTPRDVLMSICEANGVAPTETFLKELQTALNKY
eukprot:Filipodium_phascolosomae@DN4452_c0_g1_i1.p1